MSCFGRARRPAFPHHFCFFIIFFPLRRDNSGKKPLFFPPSGCEFPKAVPRCLLLCFKEVPEDEGSGVVAPGDEQRGARGLFFGAGRAPKLLTPHPQSRWHSSGFINKPQLNATRGGQSYLPLNPRFVLPKPNQKGAGGSRLPKSQLLGHPLAVFRAECGVLEPPPAWTGSWLELEVLHFRVTNYFPASKGFGVFPAVRQPLPGLRAWFLGPYFYGIADETNLGGCFCEVTAGFQ